MAMTDWNIGRHELGENDYPTSIITEGCSFLPIDIITDTFPYLYIYWSSKRSLQPNKTDYLIVKFHIKIQQSITIHCFISIMHNRSYWYLLIVEPSVFQHFNFLCLRHCQEVYSTICKLQMWNLNVLTKTMVTIHIKLINSVILCRSYYYISQHF